MCCNLYFHLEMAVQKIIGVTDLQRRFRTVLDDVVHRRIAYVLTRGSRPEAALVPYEDFLRLEDLRERHVLDRFDRLVNRMAATNASYSEEEVAEDIAKARGQRAR